MKILVDSRQTGKTDKLVEWVRQGEKIYSYPHWTRVILTSSIVEAERVRTIYNLDYRQVFSVGEWRHAKLGLSPVEIGIDNLDLVLRNLLGFVPDIATLTGENWNA